MKRITLICWLSSLLPILYFFFLLPDMPAEVPTHFNSRGEPDAYGSPWTVLLAIVVIVIPVNLILQYAPKIDPKQKIKLEQASFQRLRLLLALSMAALAVVIVHATVNPVSVNFISLIIWALFAFIGNYMQNVKHNYFIGVRTPWTLENEEVWRKTHRLTGRAFFYGGILGMILSLFLGMDWSMYILLSFSVGVTIFAFAYSYRVYKKLS
jgi:uncharacterized membrane protein